MRFPANIKYSKEHEWIQINPDNTALVGITDYAQKELGEIVFVDITHTGDSLPEGHEFGSVEAVKTVSDLLMPVTGKVVEVNAALEEHPELINEDPYGAGWIVKIEVLPEAIFDHLMDAATYKTWTGTN